MPLHNCDILLHFACSVAPRPMNFSCYNNLLLCQRLCSHFYAEEIWNQRQLALSFLLLSVAGHQENFPSCFPVHNCDIIFCDLYPFIIVTYYFFLTCACSFRSFSPSWHASSLTVLRWFPRWTTIRFRWLAHSHQGQGESGGLSQISILSCNFHKFLSLLICDRFIKEAPHLANLKKTQFSPEAILLLARFFAGSLSKDFSRLVHQFLAEDRDADDLAASLEEMTLRRRKNPRRRSLRL